MVRCRPQEQFWVVSEPTKWHVRWFYIADTLTLAFAILNIVISGFLVVGAQGLTLRGPPNSIARCVDILAGFWPTVCCCLVLSVLSLMATAAAASWMKLEAALIDRPGNATTHHNGTATLEGYLEYYITTIACTVAVTCIFMLAVLKMRRMHRDLAIGSHEIVRGDLSAAVPSDTPGAPIDLIAEDRRVIPVSAR